MAARQVFPGDALAIQLEAPVRATALGLIGGLLLFGQFQSGAVIDRRQAARQLHLSATVQFFGRLIGWVETPGGLQPLRRLFISVEPLGLVVAFVPRHPQPGQIVLDPLFELGRRASQVGVVDTQHERPPLPFRKQPVHQGGADIADVQPTRRRRGETNLDGHGGSTTSKARRLGRAATRRSQGAARIEPPSS